MERDEDLNYLFACVEAQAEHFPVPEHIRKLVAKLRAKYNPPVPKP